MKKKTFGLWRLCLVPALFAQMSMAAEAPAVASANTYRDWVLQMKQDPRGPFSGIRWYCADGSVLEPRPSGCEARGGGFQHGQWSERTRQMRAAGYAIANFLADFKPDSPIARDPDILTMLLVEKFLIASDDGWILRKAQFYRGAFQDYNERDGAKALLLALLAQTGRASTDFVVLREAARLLPHGAETAAITNLRGKATTISDRDPQFKNLRSKIHNLPEPSDALRVRQYASGAQAKPALKEEYATLAQMIDQVNAGRSLPAAIKSLSTQVRTPELAKRLQEHAASLASQTDAESQLRLSTDVQILIRDHFTELGAAKVRLAALDASLNAEVSAFTASRTLLQSLPKASRTQRLSWLGLAARSVYALGLLTPRELAQIETSLANLSPHSVKLADYRAELQELERAAAWPVRRLGFYFGNAIDKLSAIEPLAVGYVPDRLRGSVLLFYSDVLASLAADADILSKTRHSLFGEETSAGLRRLNPGLARGVLRTSLDPESLKAAGGAAAIYLVPETTADLPAVAGILTAEEGNALSHVQLLARNLGIPNVVVGSSLHPVLETYRGKPIIVAASAGGTVRIEADSPEWDRLFAKSAEKSAELIFVNIAKLDLSRTDLVPTSQLRAAHSGRIVGPKAAQVGELEHYFPEQVSPGLALPFGVYRAVLDRPAAPEGSPQPSMFVWLKEQYAELAVRKDLDPEYYARRVPEVLAFARQWIESADLGPQFRDQLRDAMHDHFGMAGTYGVFVRSDTNVEDLPGFTGAGLNLTVPNVVGLDAVITAIKQVWASPFTERAFGWRQGLMDQPEHVYASVLLHKSVPNEKSGVMVTANLDTGNREEITVVTSSGVGGGVDGQAAETLRISLKTGEARLLGSETARSKRVLSVDGGARKMPGDAPEFVLQPDEIKQLVEFVRKFPDDYPGLEDASGEIAPADIEFGFVGGRLQLLQIRPFLQSAQASSNKYLIELDAGLRKTAGKKVDLRAIPESS